VSYSFRFIAHYNIPPTYLFEENYERSYPEILAGKDRGKKRERGGEREKGEVERVVFFLRAETNLVTCH
jgi:hypothetical protein